MSLYLKLFCERLHFYCTHISSERSLLVSYQTIEQKVSSLFEMSKTICTDTEPTNWNVAWCIFFLSP